MDCNNYRTIALIPHASMIVLVIIHQRMLSYYEQELSETQAGFRKDNGTRDQILNMRLICEKQIGHSKNVYCCFIDYSKAFDCVDFELMWRTLLSFGIPKYLVECLKDLYQNQTAEVETVVGRTGPLSVQRGVRQDCPLSPMLFNMYSELIISTGGSRGGVAGVANPLNFPKTIVVIRVAVVIYLVVTSNNVCLCVLNGGVIG